MGVVCRFGHASSPVREPHICNYCNSQQQSVTASNSQQQPATVSGWECCEPRLIAGLIGSCADRVDGHTSSYLSGRELKPHDEPRCDAVVGPCARRAESGAVLPVRCVSGQVAAFPGDKHCADGIVSGREDHCTERKDTRECSCKHKGG